MKRQELLNWIKEEYHAEPEYPWEKYPGYAILRNKDDKWFAVIMDVPMNKFGIERDDLVDVVNIKADTVLIDMLVTREGFYRAYHMNKTKWMSVFLDGSVPAETLKDLVADSYAKTSKKRRSSS